MTAEELDAAIVRKGTRIVMYTDWIERHPDATEDDKIDFALAQFNVSIRTAKEYLRIVEARLKFKRNLGAP